MQFDGELYLALLKLNATMLAETAAWAIVILAPIFAVGAIVEWLEKRKKP